MVARAALAAHLPWTRAFTLGLDRIEIRDDGSRVVRFGQTVTGISVYGRGARVFLDALGTPRLASASLDERAPIAARIDAKAAARLSGGDASRAQLLYLATPHALAAAWVLPQPSPKDLPMRPVVVVDAARAKVIFRGDLARKAKQVRVFPTNPVVSSLTTLSIASLPDGSKTLSTPSWSARTCVDRKRVATVDLGPKVPMRVCDFEQTAVADAALDFLYLRPADDKSLDDVFAETSVAYHVDRGLNAFAAMGAPMLRAEARPLLVNANVRMPPSWDEGPLEELKCATCPLERMDNAFFSPVSAFGKVLFSADRDALFFGQGNKLDYAYDGDVVYHELGHALIESTAELAPFVHLDPQGAFDATGAMNEALADYVSSAITGEPLVGEYASGGTSIRDLSEAASCPGRLVNESHHDSQVFSGALWRARGEAPSKAQFDRGIMLGLQMSPGADIGFEELAEVLVKSVGSQAGEASAKSLQLAFAANGLSGCRRVRELPAPADWEFGFLSVSESSVPADLADGVVPGAMQFHRRLPLGTNRIVVRFEGRGLPPSPAWVGGDDWAPVLLVKWGSKPIVFNDDGAGFAGDHDITRELAEPLAEPFSESLAVPPGATEVHVMIGARGDGRGVYNHIEIEPFTDPVADAGPPRGDAVVIDSNGSPSDVSPEVTFDDLNGRACTCATPRPVPADPWLALLLVFGARVRVRARPRANEERP